jgi:hypothetical protein
MIRFSASAALATLAIFSLTTSWGAEQTAQKKPPAKVGSTGAQSKIAVIDREKRNVVTTWIDASMPKTIRTFSRQRSSSALCRLLFVRNATGMVATGENAGFGHRFK